MRLFFGVLLDNDARNKASSVQNALIGEYDGNYTAYDNLHITLVFIGEVDEKVSHMLVQIGDKALSGFEKFSVRAKEVNSFKDGKITHIEIEESAELHNLHDSLISLLDEANLEYSKYDGYHPHITIRRGHKYDIGFGIDEIEIEVSRICLFESTRIDGELRYIPVKTWGEE